jgi:hypothetical protein
MRKEYLSYSLPVDMRPIKPRLRHSVDCETLRSIINRIQNKNKGNPGDG